MNTFISDKKRVFGTAVTLIGAIAFGCVAAVIITAAPRSGESEPQLTMADEPVRIIAPAEEYDTSPLDPAVTHPAEEEEPPITTDDTAPRFSSPELDTEPVTEPEPVPETTVPVTIVTTTAPETTSAPEPEPEPIPEPEPEPAPTLLADELNVVHSIEEPEIAVTEEEIRYAATIIQLEVMGNGSTLWAFEDEKEKYWEMLSVAQCIRNRMESDRFPDTANEVMFQSTIVNGRTFYQFSPATTLDLYSPTEEALTAAREVLVEGVTVLPENYYYFCATRIEEQFEEWNDFMLIQNSDGTYDKQEGHLTTFYAGHK